MTTEPRALFGQALAAQRAGDVDAVVSICETILASHPKFVHAMLLLAMAKAMKGEADAAADGFREVIRVEPLCQPAYVWLSRLYLGRNNVDEALAASKEAVKLAPNDADALAGLGKCLGAQEKYHEAAEIFRRAMKIAPESASILSLLASALEAGGQLRDAAEAARRALLLAPTAAEYIRSAQLETLLGNFHEAAAALGEAVAMEPDHAFYRVLYARALRSADDHTAAEFQLGEAERLDPHLEIAAAEHGIFLQTLGRFEEARAAFERSLKINPRSGAGYYGIVSVGKVKASDGIVAEMTKILNTRLESPEDELLLQYALGKAKSDLGEYEAAMAHFELANALAKEHWLANPYSKSDFRSAVDARIRLFTDELFKQLLPYCSVSERPVFVVGMLRSGTTLLEQMLTMHSEVGGVGERAYWAEMDAALVGSARGKLQCEPLAKAALDYLELIGRLAPNGRYVIDKNPANILAVGSIHAAFPRARIIHVKRNPLDTVLSIYMTPLRPPPPFAFDKSAIVHAYQQYLRLADHWRRTLPSSSFHEVDYEELIDNGRTAVGGILEFLGLDWEEGCLHPESNVKSVTTPSFWQVRQPIFTTSIERWRNYEPFLGEFSQLLP